MMGMLRVFTRIAEALEALAKTHARGTVDDERTLAWIQEMRAAQLKMLAFADENRARWKAYEDRQRQHQADCEAWHRRVVGERESPTAIKAKVN